MLAIRIGLAKASTIIPATKQSHIMSGLRSLFSIQIIPTSYCQSQTSPHDRAVNGLFSGRVFVAVRCKSVVMRCPISVCCELRLDYTPVKSGAELLIFFLFFVVAEINVIEHCVWQRFDLQTLPVLFGPHSIGEFRRRLKLVHQVFEFVH